MAGSDHFVVIGAGHAGGVAVQAMRGSGHEGPITLIGAEPHLPYERPPLSKELLQAPGGEGFRAMRDADYYDEANITLILGNPVTAIDADAQTVTLADGHFLAFDKLLLATGGDVRRLDIPGSHLAGVHYLRTLDESRAIEAALAEGNRMVVVGGGFIGLEVAASAHARGLDVTVLEAMPQLMGRALPEEVSAMFLELHRENGIDVRLEDGVTGFTGETEVSGVSAASGKSFPADIVVVGIGIVPETELALSAGLAVDNGITVDEHARTAHPNIYAAGDNTFHFNPLLGRHLRLEAWQNAQNQAATAARNMCGENETYAETPWMWSDQFDVNLQLAGVPESWGELVLRGSIAERDFAAFQLRDGRIEAAITVNRPRDMRVIRRLMDAGAEVPADDLANEEISMRDLLKSATG
jgi:3-phenylpropionate/trans-cinnamate dioxygenase ferredoxin reductase subunit